VNTRTAPRSYFGPALLIGGGLATLGAIWLAVRKSTATTDYIERAVRGEDEPGMAKLGPRPVPTVNLHLTGYWPFKPGLTDAQRLMEGGVQGAAVWQGKKALDPATGKRHNLVTVEQHLSDPSKYPFVSLSGDPEVWPWGQKILIPWIDGRTVVGRVVDTGANFKGLGKVYRVLGEEPIDVCVTSPKTKVPPSVTAQIIPGDNFAGGLPVAVAKIKAQNVQVSGFDAEPGILEGRTQQDYEALARAIESELSGREREEQVAAAWAMRNRALQQGLSVYDMLAPRGEYGSPQKSGGYASTRRASTDASRKIAAEVLEAPQSLDASCNAIDFWIPSEQAKMRQLGDIQRAAVKSGDIVKATRYARYAGYGSEGDVRVQQARDGLCVLRAVGVVELLGRML
jgi:hypothetical protein